jgi:hypothetical protein
MEGILGIHGARFPMTIIQFVPLLLSSLVAHNSCPFSPKTSGTARQHSLNDEYFQTGVILHLLLAGYPPFWDDKQHKLFIQIRNGMSIHLLNSGFFNISKNK